MPEKDVGTQRCPACEFCNQHRNSLGICSDETEPRTIETRKIETLKFVLQHDNCGYSVKYVVKCVKNADLLGRNVLNEF